MIYITKKRTALILIFSAFCWTNCAAQDSLAQKISVIKNQCEQTDKDAPKLKNVTTDVMGMSSEGGELNKFYNGATLEMAVLTLYGETGQTTWEFYFRNEQVIFISKTHITYKAPIYMGKIEIASETVDKFYFISQILIRWIDNEGKTVDRAQYVQKQIELLDDLDIVNQN